MDNKIVKFIISLALPFIAGGIGARITYGSISSWYQYLNKPVFSPPNNLFGIVWTVLYILMGVSFYLVWISKAAKYKKEGAVRIYIIQLVLNCLWSLIFFGLHSPLLAFVELIFLWVSIFLTIRSFYLVNKKATLLLYPYLFWVTFAAFLNLSIIILNR
ncbi:MAG TPA: TspO/MBR family protein [Patescibacteria group bacterium]|nr:TspO/MBR family protein [Patescibacteria group bacterium]